MPTRSLRLLALLQHRRTWSGADLADRLGITVRTLRRDVERLRSLGYSIVSEPRHTGGYRLASSTGMPPLLLDDDEVVAVAVALRTVVSGMTGIAETAVTALAKLERVLPTRLRPRVNALQQVLSVPNPPAGAPVDARTLTTVSEACRDREILTFDYTGRDDVPARRRAEPHHLVTAVGLWYLIAYDQHRDEWRIFRVDRITEPAPTRHRFRPRPLPAANPITFVTTRIARAPTRYRAVATVAAAAETVRAYLGVDVFGRVTSADAHTCTLDLSGNSLLRITTTLTGLDADYTLDADPDVLDHLRTTATRLQQGLRGID